MIFPWIRVLLSLGILSGSFVIYQLGQSFITDLKNQSFEIASLKREVEMKKSRILAMQRMLDRRDAAIEASKCKKQISHWVRNPDEIPVPFDPFNQLTAPNVR